MSAGHDRALTVAAASPLHALPPHAKVVGAGLFVIALVSVPREALWAQAACAGLVLGVARAGRVPLAVIARRLPVLAPFLAFSLLLPFVADGERMGLLGVDVSRPGVWAAWNIVVKAILGLATMVVLVATTPVGDLLRGLDRLRVPPVFTAIATFMLRYLDVIGSELHRMQVARVSRCHDPRWLWQARAVASTAGALFVRTYERGERVHLAMVSRGYDGTFRSLPTPAASARQWATALALPAVGAAVSLLAWGAR